VLGSAAITALLAGAAAALPAQAAGSGTLVITSAPVLAMPADGSSGSLQVFLGESSTGSVSQATVTADLGSLAGVAQYGDPNSSCSVQGGQLSCTGWATPNGASLLDIPLKAAPGAALGSSAVLHLTAHDTLGSSVAFDATVVVGGSKLGVAAVPDRTVKVGDTADEQLAITNSGQLATQQTVVELIPSPGLQFAQHYANCRYGTATSDSGMQATQPQVALCTIDSGIQPGETAQLDPVGVTAGQTALNESVMAAVYPDATNVQLQSSLRQFKDFTAGSGPRLTLGEPESTPSGAPVTDYSYTAYAQATVNVSNTADFAVSGSWAPAGGGTSGTLTVGLANNGPASVFFQDQLDVQLVLPAGVSVTDPGNSCLKQNTTTTDGSTVYECYVSNWVPTGSQAAFPLGLTVDDPTAVRNAQLFLHNSADPVSTTSEYTLPFDPNPGNNRTTVSLGAPA
jgi:hypothetical protein